MAVGQLYQSKFLRGKNMKVFRQAVKVDQSGREQRSNFNRAISLPHCVTRVYDDRFKTQTLGQPAGIKSFGKRRKDLYDAEVRYWDSEVTRLFDAIHKKHKRTGYILIVSADHGSAFDKNHKKHSHGYDLHTSVLHVPMLICSSKMPARRVEKTAVGLLDITPTLVNLSGLKSDVEYAGTSLAPLLFGGLEWPDRVLFHQFYLAEKIRKGQDPLYGAAARNGRYNYMWDRREDEYLLFDYAEDPYEQTDLMEERTAIAASMDTMLKTWLYRVRNNYMKGHFESDPSFDEGGPYGYDAVYH